LIQENIRLLHNWDTEILKQHNKPGLLIHRFAMLADLGVVAADKGMPAVYGRLRCGERKPKKVVKNKVI